MSPSALAAALASPTASEKACEGIKRYLGIVHARVGTHAKVHSLRMRAHRHPHSLSEDLHLFSILLSRRNANRNFASEMSSLCWLRALCPHIAMQTRTHTHTQGCSHYSSDISKQPRRCAAPTGPRRQRFEGGVAVKLLHSLLVNTVTLVFSPHE